MVFDIEEFEVRDEETYDLLQVFNRLDIASVGVMCDSHDEMAADRFCRIIWIG